MQNKYIQITNKYDSQIQYLKMHETAFEAIWDSNGNIGKAAKTIGWDEDALQRIFDDQAACIRSVKIGKRVGRLSRKSLAHLAWQKVRGARIGVEAWKEQEDYFRQTSRKGKR